MHVLILPSAYPTKDYPLRSIFVKEHAMSLALEGINVGVVYNETRRITALKISNFGEYNFNIAINREDGINTYRLHGVNIVPMRSSFGVRLWVNKSVKLVEKYIKDNGKPDIIHVHFGLYAGEIGRIIKEKYNIKYVVTEHSSLLLNNRLKSRDKELISKIYNNASVVIAVSNELSKKIRSYTNSNVKVIPNVVNVNDFKIEKKCNREFTFLSVCNLKKDKNVELTIKAFAKVLENIKNAKLVIVGNGEEKDNLLKLADDLGVQDSIIFYGEVLRKDICKLFNKSDVFVLPSKYETFGVVYIEALATGTPVIATRCGGPEDFISDDLGLLIPNNNDIETLKDAMIFMKNNIQKYDSHKLREFAIENFSNNAVAIKTIELYKEVLY